VDDISLSPETRQGDLFLAARRIERKKTVALLACVLSDVCVSCGSEESGFGEECELCESCAAELGVL